MRVLSLFSGIGGFDLGLERAGMAVVGQVEIDPYCQRVLSRHWPDVWRGSDVRGVGVGRTGDHVEGEPNVAEADRADPQRRWANIDLICGGFPCQDLSVAGQRAGLDGARSGLWFEFQRILSELRPRWALIENVPGLLSSNQGRDFGIILDGLGECGFGGISWAILDSQHFGVAQRRRRVFIVCGPSRRATEQVLSLCESCGGHSAKGRASGEGVAGEIEDGGATPLTASGRGTERTGESRGQDALITNAPRDYRGERQDVAEPSLIAVRTAQTSANGHGIAEDVAHTLDGANGQAVAFQQNMRDEVRLMGGDGRYAGALSAEPGMKQQNYIMGAVVRRLTPTECERLQGFPDGWTDGADGPRYRALGNAVTVPVIEYIGRRIMAVDA